MSDRNVRAPPQKVTGELLSQRLVTSGLGSAEVLAVDAEGRLEDMKFD